MDKKILKFDLDSKNVKIKNILETKDFIKLEIWAISNVYPNNNNSHFPLPTMEKNVAEGNFYDKPVLGKWNSINEDLEVHNSQIKYDSEYDTVYFDYENGETPMGTIRQSDSVEIRDGKDGLKWIVFTAVLWTKYNYNAVKKLLKSRKKKVSVEVSVTKWHYDENDIEIFDEWVFDGVTILGNLPNTKTPAEAGIPDAHLTILEKIEDAIFNKQVKVVQFECNSLEKGKQNLEKENFENNQIINSDNDTDLYKEENEKGATKLLTYEQKRSILEEKLNDLAKDIIEEEKEEGQCCEFYVWVADFTDSEVFFSLNGVYYKATYEIKEEDDGSTEAFIDFKNKKKQLRSWKDFDSESVEESKRCSEENAESVEESKRCSEENAESVEESKRCSEENAESVEESKCCSEDAESVEESKRCSEENAESVEESKCCSEDSESVEESKRCSEENAESVKESVKENSDDTCKMCDFKVEINGKLVSGEKLFGMYNELVSNFENQNVEIENLTKKCNEYEGEISNLKLDIQKVAYEKLSEFAYNLAKESDLDEDACKEFSSKCLNGDYETEEDVTKDIAFAIFKNSKKTKEKSVQTEEFSVKLNNVNVKADKNEKNDAFAGCRKIINN